MPPRHAMAALAALALACALSAPGGATGLPQPQLLPAATTVAPSTAVGMRYRLQLVDRPACPATHQLSFLSAPKCSEANQKLDFNNWYQMALWDVALAGGQALGADGSVLGVPVTLLSLGRSVSNPACQGYLAAAESGPAAKLQATADYTWVLERVPNTADQFRVASKAASDAGAAVRYLGGATSCTQRGVGLYTAAGATAWRFIPFQVPSGCRPKSAACAITDTAGASNCCADLACVPAAVGGGAVCATRPTPPGFKTVVASTNAAGKVVLTIELGAPADKGAGRVGVTAYEVVALPAGGSPITLTLTGGRRRAYFAEPVHGQLCGKTFTFTARAQTAVGWSDAATEPATGSFTAPACPSVCKAQAEGCEGLSRRRLQTFYVSGNCCDGLYCSYDASETNAVCASKPSNPRIVDVGIDTSGGTLTLKVLVQGSADEGAGATPLRVSYTVRATDENGHVITKNVASPQSPFAVEFAEPEHQLCGKTWQMDVQATNQYTPPSDWVDGPPPVNAPACPPTCKAKTQACDGAPSGGGRRLHAPAEYAQGDCCDGLYCINSLSEGAVCVSKTTNPAILSATPATTASGTTIDVQVAPSSDEGAGTIALPATYTIVATSGSETTFAMAASGPGPLTLTLTDGVTPLCGKTWQLAVQTTVAFAPASDLVPGPTVTAPACPTPCVALYNACGTAAEGVSGCAGKCCNPTIQIYCLGASCYCGVD